MKTVYRNTGKIETLNDISDVFAVMVVTGTNPFVTRELVYNKLEWNGYAKHVCDKAADMIMADLKLLGNRG
tara:strand:+ start:206 stop:418 length:213 start_codon:yes stop_codon:yes gene_type:complete